MQKTIGIVVSLLLFCGPAYAEETISEKMKRLSNHSIEILGVDIYAASLLAEANSPQFIPLEMLERTGEIRGWKILEEKGYIETSVLDGMPEGLPKAKGKVLWVIRTDAGKELYNAFQTAKKHNKAN